MTETLKTVTEGKTPIDGPCLMQAIEAGVPSHPTHDELSGHPVAAWIERNLGLEDRDGKLVRVSRPLTGIEASRQLADASGLTVDVCREYVARFLLAAYQSRDDSGRMLNSGVFRQQILRLFRRREGGISRIICDV